MGVDSDLRCSRKAPLETLSEGNHAFDDLVRLIPLARDYGAGHHQKPLAKLCGGRFTRLRREAVMKQSGLLELLDHLKRLSANGDPLEELGRIVDLEGFCPVLEGVLAYSDRAKRGRPPYDPVAMFKALILCGAE